MARKGNYTRPNSIATSVSCNGILSFKWSVMANIHEFFTCRLCWELEGFHLTQSILGEFKDCLFVFGPQVTVVSEELNVCSTS